MSEQVITHYLNQRQPPLEGTLSTDITGGDPLPAGATVKFQMREVGSSTLKVDAAASVLSEPSNTVRYSWAGADVNTAGFYVGWWRVTISGQDQDTPEFPVWIKEHAGIEGQYVSVEELKASLSLTGETYANADFEGAIAAASRQIDSMTGRTFGPPVHETRVFTPLAPDFLYIGNVTGITSLSMNGSAWTEGTEYYLDGGDTLRTLSLHGFTVAGQAVEVEADFGFDEVPPEIKAATRIVAAQLVRRFRDAPFPVLPTGLDAGPVFMGRFDPNLERLLSGWTRSLAVQ